MLQPLRRESLSRVVRDYIKQYIVDNRLSAGDPLPPEGQLAEDMGVGRSSVREAVRALQSLGIIEARQGDGLYVREYNFDPVSETVMYGMRTDATTLRELAQIRMLLESATIEEAVTRIASDQVAELDDLMQRWAASITDGESDSDMDAEFHRILYGTIGNGTLLKLLEAFWVAFADFDDPALHSRETGLQSVAEHSRILDAVRARDPHLARERLMHHFRDLRERVNRISDGHDDSWFVKE
jgi:DNA-binding FadR family transcriptional regulator